MDPSVDFREEYLSELDATNAAVKATFPGIDLSAEDAARIIREHGIIEQIRIPVPPQREGASPALFNPLRWVIRNQDLLSLGNFVELFKGSLSVVLGASAYWTGPGAKLLVDGIHTFYGTYKRISQKGARLSVEEFAVFRALKAEGAAEPKDLERILTAEGLAVASDEIRGILQKYVRAGDGGFIKQRSDGKWELDGV